METAEDVMLAHFGVKGMHWGVHRNRDSGSNTPPSRGKSVSVDAARVEKAKKKVKSRGLASLSNAELRALNDRMNLEQQYNRMLGESAPSRNKKLLKKGGAVVGTILLGVGTKQAKDILNQQSSKFLIKQGLKVAGGG